MILGITGTREGMTEKQLLEVGRFLHEQSAEIGCTLHHGDCMGVDVQAARIADALGFRTVCHPPVETVLRAYHQSTVILEPLGYLARDRKIVDSVELLLVVPKQNQWQPTGGTWYTHDYAKKTGVPIKMFYPE